MNGLVIIPELMSRMWIWYLALMATARESAQTWRMAGTFSGFNVTIRGTIHFLHTISCSSRGSFGNTVNSENGGCASTIIVVKDLNVLSLADFGLVTCVGGCADVRADAAMVLTMCWSDMVYSNCRNVSQVSL